MTTLHIHLPSGHQTTSVLKRNVLVLFNETQSLRSALQSLEMSWQGGGQEQFAEQANALIKDMETQADALQILANRLEREITEWEQTDQSGASSFRGISSATTFTAHLRLPISGGVSDIPFLKQSILPMFTAISIMLFLSELPAWLNSLLERFFPTPAIVPPISDRPVETKSSDLKRLKDKNFPSDQPKQATSSAQTAASQSSSDDYDVYYNIPPQSQGTLYGSAACLPTSMSMVMDYFHAKNSANKTASPSALIEMLDKGDGTFGKGIGLNKLNDDLGELGYQSTVSTGNMEKLKTALKTGPVAVNTQVGLKESPRRDITPLGSTNHTILVKALNDKSVVINDPWSGTEKTLPRATFEQIWNKGGNYMIVVRPKGAQ